MSSRWRRGRRPLDCSTLPTAFLKGGRNGAAFRRRAVGTACDAAFHAVAKLCADYLVESSRRRDPDYARVYRALEHGPMKQAFSRSPLKDNQRLRKIGVNIVRLQSERFKADYLPPTTGLFPLNEAQELVELAREVVAEIEDSKGDSDNCRMLAVNLLFKDRKQ